MLHTTVEESIAKELANRVSENTERAVIEIAASIWTRKRGVPLRSVWMRNDLETFKKRLRNNKTVTEIALERANMVNTASRIFRSPRYILCWEYINRLLLILILTDQALHGHSNSQ